MRHGLFLNTLPSFLPGGILLWIISLIRTLIGMTHSFMAISSVCGAEHRWMSAMLSTPVVICDGVVILAAALLVAVGLFRALLGWLRFRNLK